MNRIHRIQIEFAVLMVFFVLTTVGLVLLAPPDLWEIVIFTIGVIVVPIVGFVALSRAKKSRCRRNLKIRVC